MKILGWIPGGFVILGIGFISLQMLASERVEVVEIHTLNEAGEELTTRLWVVDYNGSAYLRSSDDQSGWLRRLKQNQTITVTRAQTSSRYRAILQPELRDNINQLMQEKYTWGDTFIGLVVGRDDAIPIRLVQQ